MLYGVPNEAGSDVDEHQHHRDDSPASHSGRLVWMYVFPFAPLPDGRDFVRTRRASRVGRQ